MPSCITTYLNSTKVPVFTGHSMSAMYLKQKLTNCLYFSWPNHPMKLWLVNGSPNLNAVKPFSAKQKSKSPMTGITGVPSCSCCLTRSEPPTKPIAHLWRRADRIWSISGETSWRAGVRVPSTSNRHIVAFMGRPCRGG